MPDKSKTITRPMTGMWRDLNPMNMGPGFYDYALNTAVENFDGNGMPILQNEPSNVLCNNFPTNLRVIGFINIIELDRIIWFFANPAGGSAIGETKSRHNCKDYAKDGIVNGGCDDCESIRISEEIPLESVTPKPCCNYRTIATDACLNFNINNPVDAVAYNITDCGVDIYFSDAVNGRRHISFNLDSYDGDLVIQPSFYTITRYTDPPCVEPIYGPNLDCNKLNLQSNFELPCIDFVDLVSGGSNKAGVYQFFIAMADINKNKLSSFISATNPIPIRTKDITLEEGYATDRAIQLKIENLDELGPYSYYILAVAKTINGFTSFYEVGLFPSTQKIVTYTGNKEDEIKLTEGDIFQRYPYYKTAGAVTISNDILYWANITEYPKLNMQRIANNIGLKWQTIAIPEAAYRDPKVTNKYRSGMRDEVYPYGVQFIFTWGEETPVFHIPGRVAVSSDLEVITNDDVIVENSCGDEPRNLRWQVYNTGTLDGGELEIYDECKETCYQYGKFAYWESTEKYPMNDDIWGDLCGQPIRHHKFPDSIITHIHNRENATAVFSENDLVFPIGVKVDHDSVRAAIAGGVTDGIITQAEADSIVGYRIVRGNRFQNKSVVAKGLLYNVNHYKRMNNGSEVDKEVIYFANYPYNDSRPNAFATTEYENYKDHNTEVGADLPFLTSRRFTFHSPDTHFNQPTVGTELKLESAEYGKSEGYFTKCNKQAKQKLLSNSAYFLALTGGIVAALLRTEEKECVEYTVKSDYKIKQESNGFNYVGTGGAAVNTLTPGEVVVGTGTSGTSGSINTQISATQHDTSMGEVKESHNDPYNMLNNNVFNNAGLPTDTLTDITGANTEAEKFTRKTCKGTRVQYFNGLATTTNPLYAPLQGVLTFIGKTADFIRVMLEEMNIILDVIKSLVPFRDWTVQYNSVGKYNNYKFVPNSGFKRRIIETSSYLSPDNTLVDEPVDAFGNFSSIKFNNWNRESSLYLKYGGTGLSFPLAEAYVAVTDNSRPTMEEVGCELNVKHNRDIVSYYASIKNYVPDQYGTIYDIDYMLTESCYFKMDASNSDCRGVYGGDTFINRFALKRKVPYFLATTFGLPDGTDFNFSDYTNFAYPRHYYNTTNRLGSEFTDILDILSVINVTDPNAMFDLYGRPKSIRDCETNKFFYQNGYIYLYHYGIPYFFAESDINVDYRIGENRKEKDFYPHNRDLDTWLQQDVVPIEEDNYFFYNRAYSKQNKETPFTINGPSFEPNKDCKVTHPNMIIYSTSKNWLTYKANDMFLFPMSKGAITSLEGIENDTVLVRTVNSTFVYKSVLRLPVDGQTVQVGNGGVFANPPQEFASTKLGYIGSQHKAILHTEFGHITVDAKRGQVFNIAAGGTGVDEFSKEGLKNWFKENLPFQVLKDFPNMPETEVDNAFNAAGLCMSFDKRNNRMFITKKDYKVKNKNITYDAINKLFLLNGDIPIQLGDKRYFKDRSWTIGYNFYTKSWVSFYSFKPNYYIDFIDHFGSGNVDGFWLHNMTNSSFQVFYGKLEPWIIEPFIVFDQELRSLNSIEFDNEVRRYSAESNYSIKKDIPGINKLIAYNDMYNSGLLNLVKTDKNTIAGPSYPIRNFDNWEVEVAISKYKWRVNQMYDLVRNNSIVPLWEYDTNNADKNLNPLAFNYKKNDFDLSRLKGQWFKLRMINDKLSNYRITHKFSINDQTIQR